MNETNFFSPALAWQACDRELVPQSVLPELSRQQFAMVTELACALCRSSEAMHKIQQQTARHAALRHEAAMRKLRVNCTLADLLDIQADLLRFDIEKAGQYWQQLAAVALQTPLEIMTSACHLQDSPAGNSLKSTLHAFGATLPLVNGFFPSKPSYLLE